MSLRKHQEKSPNPYPHIGAMVRSVMTKKRISQAELARRMDISSSSLARYFNHSSLQFGILWNLGIALEYDFLTKIANHYPTNIPLNEESKLVIDLQAKEKQLEDLEKEIKIYKAALGIKES